MSVPEGKMRIMQDRHEVWLITAVLNAVIAGKQPSQGILNTIRPCVRRMNAYLEATNGSSTPYLPPDAPTEEGLG